MTPADRPDERGQRVSDIWLEAMCNDMDSPPDMHDQVCLDLRDARAIIADLRAENERLQAEIATARLDGWNECQKAVLAVRAVDISLPVRCAVRALTPPEPSP